MNVLLLIRRFDFGGAETHVRDLANSLSELGAVVHVASGKGRQIPLLRQDVRFHRFSLSKWSVPSAQIRLGLLCRRRNIDVIHAHQPSAMLNGAILSRLTGIPALGTVHTTGSKELRRPMVRNALGRLCFVSRYIMENWPRYQENKEKCLWIPNGVRIHPTRRTKSNAPGFRLVYRSRIDSSHGGLLALLLRLLPALRREFPGTTLEVIGEGKRAKPLRKAAARVRNLCGEDSVQLSGYQEEHAEEAAQSQKRLVLGTGRAAIEGLTRGDPVLAVNAARMGPMVRLENYTALAADNFVFVEGAAPNEESLRSAVTGALRSHAEAAAESDELRRLASGRFTAAETARRSLEQYRALCRRTKAATAVCD